MGGQIERKIPRVCAWRTTVAVIEQSAWEKAVAAPEAMGHMGERAMRITESTPICLHPGPKILWMSRTLDRCPDLSTALVF